MPQTQAYLWETFKELRSFHEPREAMKPSELDSWCRVRDAEFDAVERTTLLHMDIAFRANLPEPKKK